MKNESSKLDIFKETILGEVTSEMAAIKAQMEAEQKKAMADAQRVITADVEKYERSKKTAISAREQKRVSSHRSMARHAQLQVREDCASEVHDMVITHLKEFTSSDEYPEHMAKLLLKAQRSIGEGGEVFLYLREADMHLADFLRSAAPQMNADILTGRFKLGGLQLTCPSRGIRVDACFDAVIDDLIGHFSDLSGIHMD